MLSVNSSFAAKPAYWPSDVRVKSATGFRRSRAAAVARATRSGAVPRPLRPACLTQAEGTLD